VKDAPAWIGLSITFVASLISLYYNIKTMLALRRLRKLRDRW
jgi:hypothetical protein